MIEITQTQFKTPEEFQLNKDFDKEGNSLLEIDSDGRFHVSLANLQHRDYNDRNNDPFLRISQHNSVVWIQPFSSTLFEMINTFIILTNNFITYTKILY